LARFIMAITSAFPLVRSAFGLPAPVGRNGKHNLRRLSWLGETWRDRAIGGSGALLLIRQNRRIARRMLDASARAHARKKKADR
jgi:hypothetical protein